MDIEHFIVYKIHIKIYIFLTKSLVNWCITITTLHKELTHYKENLRWYGSIQRKIKKQNRFNP